MARIALALAALIASSASAQSLVEADVYESIQQNLHDLYVETITEYDTSLAENPGDVLLALKRCDVQNAFAYGEDLYVEEAETEAETCLSDVLEAYPGNLEAELRYLEQYYDDDIIDRLKALHDAETWGRNRAHHARLEKLLSDNYAYTAEGESNAARHCVKALDLDLAANCRILAADYFVSRNDTEAAISILSSPLDPQTDSQYLVQKITKLANLGARDAVARIFEQIDFESLYDWQYVELSTGLAASGMQDEATRALDRVSAGYWRADQVAKARYDVAITAGDFDAALEHYNAFRDLGYANDPLLRTRFDLFGHDATLPWRLRDALGVLTLLAGLLLAIGFAAVVPGGVHYRGLIRQQKGLPPGLGNGVWTLRHTWYGLFALILAEVLVLYFFEYDVLAAYFLELGVELTEIDLPRLLLSHSVILAFLLLPIFWSRNHLLTLGTRHWSILKCVGVGFGMAIVFRIVFSIAAAVFSDELGIGETFTTQQAILDTYREYGFLAVFLVVALLVPIIEELLFRGVLLRGFAGHVSFRAANGIQSIIFATLHESLILFPLYFALAYVAGVMALRAGGMLPALIQHVTFNATALWAIAYLDYLTNGQ